MEEDKSQILIIGHKGASKLKPENTLIAFQKAIDLQADYIEFDIQASKDGEIVVFHDYDILRLTGMEGYIEDMTLNELKQLNIGEGEQIPTLQEVIKLTRGKIGLQIEIKCEDIGKKVIEMLRNTDLIESSIVSSFIHNELLRIQKMEPELRLGALISERVSDSKDLKKATKRVFKKKFYAVHPYFTGVNQELVNYAHANNLKVNVWTVNERKDIERLINLGVDGIITDDIQLAKELIER
ncbi:MAG: glycerophosphodiester phosphodiesterase [Candidatus Hodarchaeota archaeon]